MVAPTHVRRESYDGGYCSVKRSWSAGLGKAGVGLYRRRERHQTFQPTVGGVTGSRRIGFSRVTCSVPQPIAGFYIHLHSRLNGSRNMKGALLSLAKLPQRLLTHSLGTGPSAARENSVRRELRPTAASKRSGPRRCLENRSAGGSLRS